ncbi:E3 ubiquitin-protein ligase MYCBP2-like [Oppia nitens]|uniref:E3 ubiquitin-protein ligase MYCBP2-like n=1 Tax=Oppia nitens TaxID=1686743 RepID=UPI0023DC7F3E|nr:E3 ubiquitin-protein ligase MYCBP2-like [Oppia nitens]
MPLLPMGSPLQQIAVRCFCLQFNGEDHSFLHQCHVFSNISKIFGRNDEEQSPTILDESHQSMFIHPALESYQDLTSQMEITHHCHSVTITTTAKLRLLFCVTLAVICAPNVIDIYIFTAKLVAIKDRYSKRKRRPFV